MLDGYKNIKEYNPDRKRKVLIVFHDVIAYMIINEKLNQIVTELSIRESKLKISFVFTIQSYFAVPKDVRLNFTYFFIMKNPNKRERQQIAFHHSLGTDFEGFMNLYKKFAAKSYSLLVIDTTLASDNPLSFRHNVLGSI